MNDKQKRLFRLVRELKFPFLDTELEGNIKSLSDEDLDKLIDLCKNLLAYQDMLADEARLADPEEYKKIEKEYESQIGKIRKEFAEKRREIEDGEDEELDRLEEEVRGEIKKTLEEMDKELGEFEDGMQRTED